MDMSQVNVAITGTGFMGRVHAEALKRVRGVKVLGIQGSTSEKSRRAADDLEIPIAYDTWDDLIGDDEIDAVHITTPNRLHFPQTVDAIKAGKHVMCEKPLAMTTEESAELVRLAHESSVTCGVNYNVRFYPMNLEVRQRVAAGELGRIHSVFGSYQQDWLLYNTDYNWRVLAREGGELRAVADIGTHWIDLVQNVTGLTVEAVFADLHTLHPVRHRPHGEIETFSGKRSDSMPTEPVEITTDDIGIMMLRLTGGARGALFVSQATPGRKNCLRYEIGGSRGAVEWNGEKPNQMWCGHRDSANQLLSKDPALLHETARKFTDYPGGHAEGFPDTFKMCFRSFYGFISTSDTQAAPAFATFEDGHREIRFCEAVMQSHKEQRWINI